MAGYLGAIPQVSDLPLERPEPHTAEPAIREHTTHVAFDMHQGSITAAWLLPGARTSGVRTIPHELKPFRRLVRQILIRKPGRCQLL